MNNSQKVGEAEANSGELYDVDSIILKEILEAKNGEPNKFQSLWQNDEEDVDEFTEEEIQNEPNKRILWAAENDRLEDVRQLLTLDPALVQSTDKDGYTPLHRAAYNDLVEMTQLLLSNGADVLARTSDGWQPLHSACRWNCLSVASLLLQNGADVNSQSYGGLTPLHLASGEHGNVEVVELLLSYPNVDIHLVSHAGQTPLQLASQSSAMDHLFRMAAASVNQLYPAV